MKSKAFAKKRMMFIQKEDYNFLSYILLIALKGLDCTNEQKKFRDFRKIAYLVEFINSSSNLEDYSEEELSQIYAKAQLKKQLLSHLLVVLKNHKFIDVAINSAQSSFDLWLQEKYIPEDFFQDPLFAKEFFNVDYLKKQHRSLRIITVKNLVEQLFSKRNVITWEI